MSVESTDKTENCLNNRHLILGISENWLNNRHILSLVSQATVLITDILSLVSQATVLIADILSCNYFRFYLIKVLKVNGNEDAPEIASRGREVVNITILVSSYFRMEVIHY